MNLWGFDFRKVNRYFVDDFTELPGGVGGISKDLPPIFVVAVCRGWPYRWGAASRGTAEYWKIRGPADTDTKIQQTATLNATKAACGCGTLTVRIGRIGRENALGALSWFGWLAWHGFSGTSLSLFNSSRAEPSFSSSFDSHVKPRRGNTTLFYLPLVPFQYSTSPVFYCLICDILQYSP